MSLKKRLRLLWLEAQGVPTDDIARGNWKNPNLFTPNPPQCVVCGRAWRPDEPTYIHLMGESRMAQVLIGHVIEWYSPILDVVATTGMGPGPAMRRVCPYHGDRWSSLPDCTTGESVRLLSPPSRLQSAWRNGLYWTVSALRMVWLLLSWHEPAWFVWDGVIRD